MGECVNRIGKVGLIAATGELVLFLDDDIIPEPNLIEAHLTAHIKDMGALIAGRVIQPWQEITGHRDLEHSGFASIQPSLIKDFMGGNFSIKRSVALKLGGFDENFVRVAYNFEMEFAYRLRQSGHKIYFEPAACIHHLKTPSGGTRAFGELLSTMRPDHAVGAYYNLLRSWNGWRGLLAPTWRPLRSVRTRHHMYRPWWIPISLVAELRGLVWAILLALKGPKYFNAKSLKKKDI